VLLVSTTDSNICNGGKIQASPSTIASTLLPNGTFISSRNINIPYSYMSSPSHNIICLPQPYFESPSHGFCLPDLDFTSNNSSNTNNIGSLEDEIWHFEKHADHVYSLRYVVRHIVLSILHIVEALTRPWQGNHSLRSVTYSHLCEQVKVSYIKLKCISHCLSHSDFWVAYTNLHPTFCINYNGHLFGHLLHIKQGTSDVIGIPSGSWLWMGGGVK